MGTAVFRKSLLLGKEANPSVATSIRGARDRAAGTGRTSCEMAVPQVESTYGTAPGATGEDQSVAAGQIPNPKSQIPNPKSVRRGDGTDEGLQVVTLVLLQRR